MRRRIRRRKNDVVSSQKTKQKKKKTHPLFLFFFPFNLLQKKQNTARTATASTKPPPPPLFDSLHHVGLLVSDLERSLRFYQGVLGLELNRDRPDDKLPYRGAWLWIGTGPSSPNTFTGQMIHLMELPSPDPTEGRPAHGGRDRHFCVSVRSVAAVVERLEKAGVPYTSSASGRAAAFFRDPDGNVLECAEMAK